MIYVIRHGETDSNFARVVQTPETPLNPRGILQAERLGERLAGAGIARILSSDYARALMTAEALARATGAPIGLEPLLEERNYGEIRGLAYDTVGRDIVADDYDPPGGETWPQFHARVDRAWERIRAAAGTAGGDLAVVTHGLVCYSLALRHLQLPAGAVPPRRWANTSVTRVEPRPPWRVEILDDASHLDSVSADRAAPSGI
jgi:probable phosphoglycerate mutase